MSTLVYFYSHLVLNIYKCTQKITNRNGCDCEAIYVSVYNYNVSGTLNFGDQMTSTQSVFLSFLVPGLFLSGRESNGPPT